MGRHLIRRRLVEADATDVSRPVHSESSTHFIRLLATPPVERGIIENRLSRAASRRSGKNWVHRIRVSGVEFCRKCGRPGMNNSPTLLVGREHVAGTSGA